MERVRQVETATEPRGPTDEPRWHASIAVVAALALYVPLSPRLTFGPSWVFPVIVLIVLVPLSIFAPSRHLETPAQRIASVVLIAIVNAFNVLSVLLLIHYTVFSTHGKALSGQELLVSGAQIWVTNILVYALWFWEIDGGGPESRAHAASAMEFINADFLFPQMLAGDGRVASIERRWKPFFLDYLYLAFTNALAFSPTDVMPLTRTAKVIMMLGAITSFITIAVVLARAINMVG